MVDPIGNVAAETAERTAVGRDVLRVEQTRPAVEVEDLVVVRGGRPVLPGISVTIAADRVTGLLGPSGSGKTRR